MLNVIRRVLMFFSLIALVAFGAGYALTGGKTETKEDVKYYLKAFTKDKDQISQMQKIADDKGLTAGSKTVKKFIPKKIGYAIRFYISDKDFLKQMKDVLKTKKVNGKAIPVKIAENEDAVGGKETFYMQVYGNIKDQKKAETLKDKVKEAISGGMAFEVQENQKKFPYTAIEITVINIPNEEEANALKEEFAAIAPADNVLIEPMNDEVVNDVKEDTEEKTEEPVKEDEGDKKADKTKAKEADKKADKSEKENKADKKAEKTEKTDSK